MTQPTEKIRIAIIGGGIGGLSLALTLLKLPHLQIHIYEAAHQFSEIGAGVAFGPNAQRALRLMGEDVEAAYLKHATSNGHPECQKTWFEYIYGCGPSEGMTVAEVKNETGQSTLHRAKFLEEFVKLLPEGIARFGKRLAKIDDKDSSKPVSMTFQDGSTAQAECVIGADGIHSVVRRHLLGEDHPAVNPSFTGSVGYRGLVPMAEAVAALGGRAAKNSFVYLGKGASVMTYPIDGGKTVNVVALNSTFTSWEGPWVQKAEYAKMVEEFSQFGSHVQKIIQLLDTPGLSAWSLWDHAKTPTYYRGRVAMMGDAAHASTPFQGQGAAQAIEDAYVLGSLLQRVKRAEQSPAAFHAYDAVRRPRSQMVCKTSREAGELIALRLKGVEDDAEAIKENICWRMDWMWHRDVDGERVEAGGLFEDALAAGISL